MIKSPLRYPGGKSRAVAKIAALVPPFEEYREPFLGGGSVFLHFKQQHPERRFWVNDVYFELYKFWEQTQHNVQGVIAQVNEWRAQFENGKALYRFLTAHMAQFDEVERASAFFVFNRITFSGTTEAGGFSEQAYSGRFTPSSIERLIPFAETLTNTRISNHDYEVLLDKAGNDVFLFLDPPYHAASKSALYGKKGKLHTGFDHERLAQKLMICPHKWLMTYDDSPYIRELYHFAEIVPWSLTYGMRNITPQSDQKGKEVFIANYPLTSAASRRLVLFETEA